MKIRIYKVGQLYGLQVKNGWLDSWHCGSWMIRPVSDLPRKLKNGLRNTLELRL